MAFRCSLHVLFSAACRVCYTLELSMPPLRGTTYSVGIYYIIVSIRSILITVFNDTVARHTIVGPKGQRRARLV